MRFFLIALFIGFGISASFGQNKYEKESRISPKTVPDSALDFVSHFAFTKKVKWYQEESLSGQTIEAKSKIDKQKYSIEFDLKGQLQDVEIEIPYKEVNLIAQESICDQLNKDFSRFKIVKIQQQFSGRPNAILTFLKNNSGSKSFKIQYEIVLEGKNDPGIHLYEYTFSEQGKIVSKAKIILRNTDNLEY